MDGYLTASEYETVVKSVPIFCVDLVIIKNNKVLLIKRNNKPMKGKYFTPGGRILKNETIEEAIKRKGKEELGIDLEKKSQLATYEFFFKDSQVKNIAIHGVGGFYHCISKDEKYKINLDRFATEYKWEHISSENLHQSLKELFSGKKEIIYKEE